MDGTSPTPAPPVESSLARIPLSHRLIFWTIALGGAVFDLVTKSLIFGWVGPPGRPPIPLLPPVLEFRTSHNTGALWGIGSSFPHSSLLFALLSIAAAVFIYHWLFRLGHGRDLRQTVSLGLIMAGALGNCHDRIRFGFVRDFVYFHVDSIGFDFPIFNFADNMLVAGAAILMLLALRPERLETEGDGKAHLNSGTPR